MEQESLKSRKKRAFYYFIGFVLFITAFVMILLYLLRGETTIDNSGGDYDTMQSVTCEGDGVAYPLLKNVKTESSHLKVLVTLGKEKLESISFTYNILNLDEKVNEENRANARYEMNKAFEADSLGADAFDATYSSLESGLQMRIFAETKDLNGMTYKYFLLEDANGNLKKDTITKLYNEKGLDCVVNN